MQARRVARVKAAALHTWATASRDRLRCAAQEAAAGRHAARGLLSRAMWAWSAVARQSAAANSRQEGLRQLQRAAQAAVRWRRLCDGAARVAAVQQRAARLHAHRVLGHLLRAALHVSCVS